MTFDDKYGKMIKKKTREWYNLNQSLTNPQWEKPIYAKKQIERAGKALSKSDLSEQEKKNALKILDNWRASHAYPLQVIANNLRRNNPNAIVVQRLKRLESIVEKLKRFPDMNLYRMQDLGGCRIIVDTIGEVYQTVDKYKKSNIRHILKRENDYITNPKSSGYRSYHMAYQFYSDKKDTYNNHMLIEIQVRTKLQHIWATAVEMMGIYTKTSLKSSMGDKDVLRFFTLVSSIFAIMEQTPVCPKTSDDIRELGQEIKKLDQKHNILSTLRALSAAIDNTSTDKEFKNGYFLLALNYSEMTVSISSFKKNQVDLATRIYNEAEKNHNDNVDIVLVSANSFDTVRTAYPNYFTDISKFTSLMKDILNI